MKRLSLYAAAFLFALCACSSQSSVSDQNDALPSSMQETEESGQSGEGQASDAAILQNTKSALILQALENMDSLESVLEELEIDGIISDQKSSSQSQFNLADSFQIYSSQSENTDSEKTFTFNQDGEDLILTLCQQPADQIPFQKEAYYALVTDGSEEN